MATPVSAPRVLVGVGLSTKVLSHYRVDTPDNPALPLIRYEGGFRREAVSYSEFTLADCIDHVASDSYGAPSSKTAHLAAAEAACRRLMELVPRFHELAKHALGADSQGLTQAQSPIYTTDADRNAVPPHHNFPFGTPAPSGRTVTVAQMKAGLTALKTDIDAATTVLTNARAAIT
ncbi:MAG: hypothetical protein HOW73_00735 [Polyangiaceae bacterium]|nr:hypothetical protein [Polyangiaceae bacterium]